jgi:O-antigen/teichoic acid export membrane protein
MSIGRNTAVNLAGQIFPVLVSLLIVPPYLHMIGEARYGVLLIVWMFLGYFGLFDFGLSRAVAQRVAELRDNLTGSRNRVVWTALLLASALSVLGAITLYLAGSHGLERCFGVDASLRREFLAALPWMALVLPANLMGGTLSGALQGREQFVRINIIQNVGTIWAQLVPMAVAWRWSTDLRWLVPAALSARVVTGIWMFVECRRQVPLTTFPVYDRSLVRSLFSYGGWVTVSSIVGPILTTFDRFVIGLMGGAAAVTHYSVPSGIVSRVSVLPSALSSATFPRFAVGDQTTKLKLLVQSTGALAAVFTPICLVMMFAIGPFLSHWSHWISPELAAKGTLVGELLIIGVWVNGLALLPHAYLQANARPRISAVFHLAELLPYMLVLWLGLKFWGVAGAALAGSLRMIADTILHYWATDDGGSSLGELMLPGLMILAGLAAVMTLGADNPWRWVAACGLLTAAVFWGWSRIPEIWRQRAVPLILRREIV